jgi:hypothetical protein
MTKTAPPIQELKKSPQHRYHAIFAVHNAASISTRDFMGQFADYANRWHGHKVKVTYKWIRHENGTLIFAITGTRSVLKAFEAYLEHVGVADRARVEHYGHRHSEFERDVALLFHPVHGRHGRGASR